MFNHRMTQQQTTNYMNIDTQNSTVTMKARCVFFNLKYMIPIIPVIVAVYIPKKQSRFGFKPNFQVIFLIYFLYIYTLLRCTKFSKISALKLCPCCDAHIRNRNLPSAVAPWMGRHGWTIALANSGVPSGKLLHNYRKSPFLMGKSPFILENHHL